MQIFKFPQMENLKFSKYGHTRYHIANLMMIQSYKEKRSKLLENVFPCWGRGGGGEKIRGNPGEPQMEKLRKRVE